MSVHQRVSSLLIFDLILITILIEIIATNDLNEVSLAFREKFRLKLQVFLLNALQIIEFIVDRAL